jgi:hypothetical protein
MFVAQRGKQLARRHEKNPGPEQFAGVCPYVTQTLTDRGVLRRVLARQAQPLTVVKGYLLPVEAIKESASHSRGVE